MDERLNDVRICLSEYPELLKVCTAAADLPRSGATGLDLMDDVTGGVHRKRKHGGDEPDVAEKCLAWLGRCRDMDFFRTFPEVALLYSPYSAVAFAQYTGGATSPSRPPLPVTLYPGGATVPEHCLAWSPVDGARPPAWLPNPDRKELSLTSATGKLAHQTAADHIVPTSCSSGVFHAEAKYSNRHLRPELVPSDLTSGTSYHRVSVRPYVARRPDPGSDVSKVSAFVDAGGRTTPSVCATVDVDRKPDVVVNGVTTEAASTLTTATTADDVIERPDSVISLIRPASSLADYDSSHFRPDSGLGDGEPSSRPDSSLSQYDNGAYYDVIAGQDQSLRPDSAFSHFSELDSGIDDFRSHSTTPPPSDGGRHRADAPSTGSRPVVYASKNGHVDTDDVIIDRRRDVAVDVCDENRVSSTSDDVDRSDNDDDDAQAAIGDRLPADESVASGSTCSSGQLMIDTNSDLEEEELSCHSDPEGERRSQADSGSRDHRSTMTSASAIGSRSVLVKADARRKHTGNSGSVSVTSGSAPSWSSVTLNVTSPSGTASTSRAGYPGGPVSAPQLSGYMYSRASSGAIPNPINMGYVPTAASGGCVPSLWTITGAGDPGTGKALPSQGLVPRVICSYPGSYPFYQPPPVLNYYLGVNPYTNFLPWMMGYPGYYPHLPYSGMPTGHARAPPSNAAHVLGPPSGEGQKSGTRATSDERRDITSSTPPPTTTKRKRRATDDGDVISDVKRRHV